MRDYGKVHISFWSSETLRGIGEEARVLALYLLTSPHTTMIGAFRLPDAYACEDLGWTPKQFRNGLETLSACSFIKYCDRTRVVWVRKFLQWNRPENPNQRKAAVKLAEALPADLPFKDEILTSLGVSETVSEPLRNTPVPVPVPVPASGAVLAVAMIPLENGSEHPVTEAEIAEYRTAYPRIDVVSELRKVRAWCVANPSKRKTARGVARFLNSWLDRANKDAPVNVVSMASLPGGGRRAL